MAAARQVFPEGYERPEVWTPPKDAMFGGMNLPTAGVRSEVELPRGEHPIQLYSLATPNGKKVGIMLEELGVDYDGYICKIFEHKQFTSGFTECNPNQKIPCMFDYSQMNPDTNKPLRIFETGSILLYLADKYKQFVPPVEQVHARQECLNWLFWQMGGAPYIGGGFGHFYAYAPHDIAYAIDRFTMEVKRQLDLLDKHLGGEDRYFQAKDVEPAFKPRDYILGDEYSIADMAIYPWILGIINGGYKSPAGVTCDKFLDAESYVHVNAWVARIKARPAVRRGSKVCSGDMPERHSKEDFPKEDYE